MSESYYSSYEVERKFADYEERLAKQQREIERLKFHEEEEDESDYIKIEKGRELRRKLEKKYNCGIKEAISKINYNDSEEFGDYYFAMFDTIDIENDSKENFIPEIAYRSARKEQIKNIPNFHIRYFNTKLGLFGERAKYFTEEQLWLITYEQYVLLRLYLRNMPEYLLKQYDSKYYASYASQAVPLQYKNDPCLII